MCLRRVRMKSSTGAYYIALDHVRAVAAFTVFVWHFNHVNSGELAGPPTFPLSVFAEGHTGVAIFMTLSGYLFAKILDGKSIIFPAFIWNRCLRLLPLLAIVSGLVGLKIWFTGGDVSDYGVRLAEGFVLPKWPNGGWSIAVELHFYLLLPFVLWLRPAAMLAILLAMVAVRTIIFASYGEVEDAAYWTIVGRVDQFLLGIAAFNLRDRIAGRHIIAICVVIGFLAFYRAFDAAGGFYGTLDSPIWIIMPTIEGLAYAFLIAWYDNSFQHGTGIVSRTVAKVGECSYSIYLLHVFVVFALASRIDGIYELPSTEAAMLLSIPAFLAIVPFAYLSYRFIELPFLRYRVRYIRQTTAPQSA